MGKRIFQKTSVTAEEKLSDLLANTDTVGECRIWNRALNTDGYPHMLGNVKVHRLVYQLKTGENIKGLVIRHTCDNPKCINPEHLLTGLQRDNNKDMVERNRYHRVITGEIVKKTRVLLATKMLLHSQIAELVGIDWRRVSDINCNRYADDGKFTRHP